MIRPSQFGDDRTKTRELIGAAFGARLVISRLGQMTGRVVAVVTVLDGAYDRELVEHARLFGHLFAEMGACHVGVRDPKITTVFPRCFRFGVVSFKLGWAACEFYKNDRRVLLCRQSCLRGQGRGTQPKYVGESQATISQCSSAKKSAARNTIAECSGFAWPGLSVWQCEHRGFHLATADCRYQLFSVSF